MPKFQSIYEFNREKGELFDLFHNLQLPDGFIPIDAVPKDGKYSSQDSIKEIFEWFEECCIGDLIYEHMHEYSPAAVINGKYIGYMETYWFEKMEDAVSFKIKFMDMFDFRYKLGWNVNESGRFFIPQ